MYEYASQIVDIWDTEVGRTGGLCGVNGIILLLIIGHNHPPEFWQ